MTFDFFTNSLLLSCVVYVWLLSPFPGWLSEWINPKKTPLNTLQGVISYCRIEISEAMYCDKCNGFWWGIGGALVIGYEGVNILLFACLNVVLTKLIYNNVP